MRALKPVVRPRPGEGPEGGSSAPQVEPERPALRLAASRGGLALELEQPLRVGSLTVSELAIRLPGLRFPVDLSGGVGRFRHRRGQLDALQLEVGAVPLGQLLRTRLRGFLGSAALEVTVIPTPFGVVVGLSTDEVALAWDVVVCPAGDDLVLVVEQARALGLQGAEHALAHRALDCALRPFGRMEGGVARARGVARALCRAALPSAGARAPSLEGFTLGPFETHETRLHLRGGSGPSQPPSERVLRALELADLGAEADQAAFEGDLERARQGYLAGLERAPRHPELAQRLAALDRAAEGRAEAALATLVEVTPAVDGGLLGAELLATVGDRDGARVAYHRAAVREPYAPLAALAWLRVADLSENVRSREAALDEAVARAPSLARPRWARLGARARLADVKGALADAQHLEAAASGARARHEALRRAAAELLVAGLVQESAGLFERALRYVPDDAEALKGLAQALLAAGRGARAVELLRRASSLVERRGQVDEELALSLARTLVEVTADRPAAIAHLRAIGPASPWEPEARLLEGRLRIELGDLAGGGLALGRLRDAVERLDGLAPTRARELALLLRQGAELEERERADVAGARRCLALAVRLDPRDGATVRAFRRLAEEAPTPARPTLEAPERPSASAPSAAEAPTADEDDLAVERLTERLRADPNDRSVVLALADALSRRGRDLELLALLSARIDEGDDDLRAELLPRRRVCFANLASAARAEGRADEAELYEMMLASED
jgi:tetratricopeptide (TPR) repeat protein